MQRPARLAHPDVTSPFGAWGTSVLVDLRGCRSDLLRSELALRDFAQHLCRFLQVQPVGDCMLMRYGEKPEITGYSMVQLIETSLISGHFVELHNNAYIDVFACERIDGEKVARFCGEFFAAAEIFSATLERHKWPGIALENEKAAARETEIYGLGLFAKCDLNPGEAIAAFDGPIYRGNKASDIPNDPPLMVRDRAIQISASEWQDSVSPARFAAHSCNPNSGIGGRTQLVAMRHIPAGTEITFDYDMTEDSDWRMDCLCGEKQCRRLIRGFRHLPQHVIERYGTYVSDWLIDKYRLA
jgi:S-adenosylmethionine/arginine decarboxylase-like enzyme